jgi:hypothetical protein
LKPSTDNATGDPKKRLVEENDSEHAESQKRLHRFMFNNAEEQEMDTVLANASDSEADQD